MISSEALREPDNRMTAVNGLLLGVPYGTSNKLYYILTIIIYYFTLIF